MIDPLSRFEAEHEEALDALARLETAALGLQRGEPAGPHLAGAHAVHSILTTAVKAHNEAEERALFPLLGGEAPTAVFVEEHTTLRDLEHQLELALAAGDVGRVATAALLIVDLLRAHIARENEVLFPMARELLGAAGLAEAARRLSA
ncbi:MAG: hemerythrin domain-containing protein [Gemmatimonadales bacterium]|nr:hemerythrin domain-containing protein [Gemmatimonadales bacterium]